MSALPEHGTRPSSGQQVDVVPLDDLAGHVRGAFCGCRPSIEIVSGEGRVVTHRAYDGREQIEDGSPGAPFGSTGLQWACVPEGESFPRFQSGV